MEGEGFQVVIHLRGGVHSFPCNKAGLSSEEWHMYQSCVLYQELMLELISTIESELTLDMQVVF
jgi:hypothetical protein